MTNSSYSNQGNINNMNNAQVFTSIPDNGIYNNSSLYNKNVIYPSYQNVSTQPSIVGQQDPNQLSTYQQYSQTNQPQNQYINSNTFPSPLGMTLKNDKLGNPQNQNQNILYSPVSTASSSPTPSNTFNNTEPTNFNSLNKGNNVLSSTVLSTNYTLHDSNINGQNPTNNSITSNGTQERKMSLGNATIQVIDNKSKSQVNDNSHSSSAALYTNSSITTNGNSNMNSSVGSNVKLSPNSLPSTTMAMTLNQKPNLSPSMNNGYLLKTQTQTTTFTTNPYYGANGQIPSQQQPQQQPQATPLPLPQQQNINVVGSNNPTPNVPSQNNPSYVIQATMAPTNQSVMFINSNPQAPNQAPTQGQPMQMIQNTTSYNQVYYANGQPAPSLPNQPVIFNNINENILLEQQKMISMELAIKRKKNTEAARRSRMRKMLRMENLEKYVKQLENDNNTLSMKIAILEGNRPEWNEKETKLRDRIRELERELSEYKPIKRKVEEDESNNEEKAPEKKIKQEAIETKKEE